jgi:hypothetical protein
MVISAHLNKINTWAYIKAVISELSIVKDKENWLFVFKDNDNSLLMVLESNDKVICDLGGKKQSYHPTVCQAIYIYAR